MLENGFLSDIEAAAFNKDARRWRCNFQQIECIFALDTILICQYISLETATYCGAHKIVGFRALRRVCREFGGFSISEFAVQQIVYNGSDKSEQRRATISRRHA